MCVHLTYVPYPRCSRRTENQTYTALGKGIAKHRYSAGYPRIAREHELGSGIAPKNCQLLQRVARCRGAEPRPTHDLRSTPLHAGQDLGLHASFAKLGMPVGQTPGLGPWRSFLDRRHKATKVINVGLLVNTTCRTPIRVFLKHFRRPVPTMTAR